MYAQSVGYTFKPLRGYLYEKGMAYSIGFLLSGKRQQAKKDGNEGESKNPVKLTNMEMF